MRLKWHDVCNFEAAYIEAVRYFNICKDMHFSPHPRQLTGHNAPNCELLRESSADTFAE